MSVGSSKSSTSSSSSSSRSSSSSSGASRSSSTSGENRQTKSETKTPKTGTTAAKNKTVDQFEAASSPLAKRSTSVKQLRASGGGTSNLDIDKAVAHLNANAHATSQKKCAQYVRQAIEAGGVRLDVNTRPGEAKDYGPYLGRHGFTAVNTQNYVPQKGDVAVIQPYPGGSAAGHITMYNGSQWVSDFTQRDMWSGPGYRKHQPSYEIYRP
ncbi:hypothetical protein SAMN05443639_108198 [Stigmatella erecta]|uniref:CHAP domain-containing protein n=1 Tax=Stigmatella erecta TaxID=83460 RepID=A0A1I0JWK9_9BACT|nr:hypothetical protein SAMN05443639_108198 [Stigmatella erecta]